MNNVQELQKGLFGFLHDFHTERTAEMLKALQEEYGDEIITIIENVGVDKYGLYRWHLERTISIIDTLSEKIGPRVKESIVRQQEDSRREEGEKLAQELGSNSLEDIVRVFSGGNSENIIEKNDNEFFIKWTGCLAGRIARDIDRTETVYALHCNTDKDFVEGFNSSLGCEIVQTIMQGHDCCIHRLYIKSR